ncbi:hypothetical protein Golob_022750 [Gossypium lobatum]|uniref:Uncharacterized protein n=1 Tax=Gossypium lobatum TaxID=34289 RepID=A0A7J8LI11_9ROSI|nr:hypothetical protein [Gossypium lobatum]
MMLGKRSRQPIKRTTSMTGITVDVSDAEDVVDQHHQDPIISHLPPPQIHPMHESPDVAPQTLLLFCELVGFVIAA